jgi:hypothetical protein
MVVTTALKSGGSMARQVGVFCAVLVGIVGSARPVSADWLFTAYAAPLYNVKTAASTNSGLPAETFDNSVGFGVNFASAFPSRGNLGFELDWAYSPKGLHTSEVFGTAYASRLMSISTNFFFSPAVPRVRPYFSLGPSFSFRSDDSTVLAATPSGWAVGVNGGAGLIAFITQRFGLRLDVRYNRNFGDFYDLREDVTQRSSGWSDLEYLRGFVGVTIVLN